MQMFNGITMGMLGIHSMKLDPETGNEGDGATRVEQDSKIKNITDNINKLKDDDGQNDVEAKNQLDSLLTEEFLNSVNSLSEDTKSSLKTALKQLLDKHKQEENFQETYENLVNLGKKLGISIENDDVNSELKLNLKGELSNLTALEDGANTTGRFYSKLVENKPEDDNDNDNQEKDNNLDLRRTKEVLDEQLTKINKMLQKLKNNDDFNKTKQLIENILKIIKNPIESNVQTLQKFISENLDGQDKQDFDKKSKRGENFDGKFGVGTLTGLNKILEKAGKYIDEMENRGKIEQVTAKANIQVKKGDQIDAKNLVEGVSNGVSVELAEGQSINTSNTGEIKVIINVKLGNDVKKVLNVKVNIVDDVVENTGTTQQTTVEQAQESDVNQIDATPLTIGNSKHLVLESTQAISKNAQLNGVIFYSMNEFNGDGPAEGEQWQKESAPTGKDYECLMKVEGEVFKVKIDKNGNLFPLIENSKGVRSLIKNNESCKNYLRNVLPGNLPGNPIIARNDDHNDYVIRTSNSGGGRKGMTIEPMELDGYGVSENLSEHLTLMNLANNLRGLVKGIGVHEFYSQIPNIKLDGNKLKFEGKDERGRRDWYDIPSRMYGGITNEKVLKKFVKFNNHEDRGDDWDVKRKNKDYGKIDLKMNSRNLTFGRGG